MRADAMSDERAAILLVDDMEDNLIALESVLASLDQPLVRARSGEEALKVLLRRRVALVLLDIRMPGMDGFETAADVKRLDQTKHVPGASDHDDAAAARAPSASTSRGSPRTSPPAGAGTPAPPPAASASDSV